MRKKKILSSIIATAILLASIPLAAFNAGATTGGAATVLGDGAVTLSDFFAEGLAGGAQGDHYSGGAKESKGSTYAGNFYLGWGNNVWYNNLGAAPNVNMYLGGAKQDLDSMTGGYTTEDVAPEPGDWGADFWDDYDHIDKDGNYCGCGHGYQWSGGDWGMFAEDHDMVATVVVPGIWGAVFGTADHTWAQMVTNLGAGWTDPTADYQAIINYGNYVNSSAETKYVKKVHLDAFGRNIIAYDDTLGQVNSLGNLEGKGTGTNINLEQLRPTFTDTQGFLYTVSNGKIYKFFNQYTNADGSGHTTYPANGFWRYMDVSESTNGFYGAPTLDDLIPIIDVQYSRDGGATWKTLEWAMTGSAKAGQEGFWSYAYANTNATAKEFTVAGIDANIPAAATDVRVVITANLGVGFASYNGTSFSDNGLKDGDIMTGDPDGHYGFTGIGLLNADITLDDVAGTIIAEPFLEDNFTGTAPAGGSYSANLAAANMMAAWGWFNTFPQPGKAFVSTYAGPMIEDGHSIETSFMGIKAPSGGGVFSQGIATYTLTPSSKTTELSLWFGGSGGPYTFLKDEDVHPTYWTGQNLEYFPNSSDPDGGEFNLATEIAPLYYAEISGVKRIFIKNPKDDNFYTMVGTMGLGALLEDQAIIDELKPLMDVQYTLNGIDWISLEYTLENFIAGSQDQADEQQGIIAATIPPNASGVRVVLSMPETYKDADGNGSDAIFDRNYNSEIFWPPSMGLGKLTLTEGLEVPKSDVTITATSETKEIGPGDAFNVTLSVDGIEGNYVDGLAMMFTYEYDASVVELIDEIIPGAMEDYVITNDTVNGLVVIIFNVTSMDAGTLKTDGDLVTLIFQAKLAARDETFNLGEITNLSATTADEDEVALLDDIVDNLTFSDDAYLAFIADYATASALPAYVANEAAIQAVIDAQGGFNAVVKAAYPVTALGAKITDIGESKAFIAEVARLMGEEDLVLADLDDAYDMFDELAGDQLTDSAVITAKTDLDILKGEIESLADEIAGFQDLLDIVATDIAAPTYAKLDAYEAIVAAWDELSPEAQAYFTGEGFDVEDYEAVVGTLEARKIAVEAAFAALDALEDAEDYDVNSDLTAVKAALALFTALDNKTDAEAIKAGITALNAEYAAAVAAIETRQGELDDFIDDVAEFTVATVEIADKDAIDALLEAAEEFDAADEIYAAAALAALAAIADAVDAGIAWEADFDEIVPGDLTTADLAALEALLEDYEELGAAIQAELSDKAEALEGYITALEAIAAKFAAIQALLDELDASASYDVNSDLTDVEAFLDAYEALTAGEKADAGNIFAADYAEYAAAVAAIEERQDELDQFIADLAELYNGGDLSGITLDDEAAINALDDAFGDMDAADLAYIADPGAEDKIEALLTKIDDLKGDTSIVVTADPGSGIKIPSDLDGYVTGVAKDTTADDLEDLINVTNGGYVKFTDADDNELDPTDLIGTGCKMVAYDKLDAVVATMEIVVAGDVDGDGSITGADMNAVIDNILGVEGSELTGVYFEAAHISPTSVAQPNLTIFDLVAIKKLYIA